MNTVNAKIDSEKDIVTVGLGHMSHDFNFSKFHRQPHDKELPSKDEIIGLASIAVPPTDPLEQYLLEPWKWYAYEWKKWNRWDIL